MSCFKSQAVKCRKVPTVFQLGDKVLVSSKSITCLSVLWVKMMSTGKFVHLFNNQFKIHGGRVPLWFYVHIMATPWPHSVSLPWCFMEVIKYRSLPHRPGSDIGDAYKTGTCPYMFNSCQPNARWSTATHFNSHIHMHVFPHGISLSLGKSKSSILVIKTLFLGGKNYYYFFFTLVAFFALTLFILLTVV